MVQAGNRRREFKDLISQTRPGKCNCNRMLKESGDEALRKEVGDTNGLGRLRKDPRREEGGLKDEFMRGEKRDEEKKERDGRIRKARE